MGSTFLSVIGDWRVGNKLSCLRESGWVKGSTREFVTSVRD